MTPSFVQFASLLAPGIMPTPTPTPTPGPTVGVTSWTELRDAVNAAPIGQVTTIQVLNSFSGGTSIATSRITIPANRHIIVVSSNTAVSSANIRTLTRTPFIVSESSSLTLGRNITLSSSVAIEDGGRAVMQAGSVIDVGNVTVSGGSEFVMYAGSVIENGLTTAVTLNGWGTGESTQARFTMLGGVIRNNTGARATRAGEVSVGGVRVGENSVFVMSGDSVISNNTTNHTLMTAVLAGGVLLSSPTSVFEMRDNATIRDNEVRDITPFQHAARGQQNASAVLMLNGSFTMYNGSIAGNSNLSIMSDGDVQVLGGVFTMHAGNITNNRGYSSVWGSSASVHIITDAVFILNGGTISNNTRGVVNRGTMVMNGGSINNNERGGVSTSNIFEMHDGEISGNYGGGVQVWSHFTMSGGKISGNHANTTNREPNGSGVHVSSSGVFNMTSDAARIENNILEIGSDGGGGGIFVTGGTVNISAGVIIGNSVRVLDGHGIRNSGGGGIMAIAGGTVNISGGLITNNSAPLGGGINLSAGQNGIYGILNMTGGSIIDNSATHYGGGIHTVRANHSYVLPETAFNNLNIGAAVIFSGNTAGNGLSAPPDNRLPHIATTHASRWGNPLNNYDINYTGRLGQEHGIRTWAELRAAVNAAPANIPTTIYILNSIEAPTGAVGNAITIPSNRQITLISSNTTPGSANVRVLSQANAGQQHFIVSGSLTLDRNIALQIGNDTGGVQIAGGTFIMGDGSSIIPR